MNAPSTAVADPAAPAAAVATDPPEPAYDAASGVNRGLRKTARRKVDEDDIAKTAARLIRNLGVRAGQTDASVLKDLLALHEVIDEVAGTAARALHDREGLSWGVIGSELGITRQAARQKWADA